MTLCAAGGLPIVDRECVLPSGEVLCEHHELVDATFDFLAGDLGPDDEDLAELKPILDRLMLRPCPRPRPRTRPIDLEPVPLPEVVIEPRLALTDTERADDLNALNRCAPYGVPSGNPWGP